MFLMLFSKHYLDGGKKEKTDQSWGGGRIHDLGKDTESNLKQKGVRSMQVKEHGDRM